MSDAFQNILSFIPSPKYRLISKDFNTTKYCLINMEKINDDNIEEFKKIKNNFERFINVESKKHIDLLENINISYLRFVVDFYIEQAEFDQFRIERLNVKELEFIHGFDCYFILPKNLKILKLGFDFNKLIEFDVKELYLGFSFNLNLDLSNYSIEKFSLYSCNTNVIKLCNTIKTLILGYNNNVEINEGIRNLYLHDYDKIFDHKFKNIVNLYIGNYNMDFNNKVFENLLYLSINYFNKDITLPKNLLRIDLGEKFDSKIYLNENVEIIKLKSTNYIHIIGGKKLRMIILDLSKKNSSISMFRDMSIIDTINKLIRKGFLLDITIYSCDEVKNYILNKLRS